MTAESALFLARLILAVYAVILVAGGTTGYVKAGSRPSLIAGLVSGLLAMICLGFTVTSARGGIFAGIILAGAMAVVFIIRLKKTGKIMPSGMLMILSLAVAGALFAAGMKLA